MHECVIPQDDDAPLAYIWVVILILIIPLVGNGYVTPDQALQMLTILLALFHQER